MSVSYLVCPSPRTSQLSPERDEHDQFDAEELSDGFDGVQLLFESAVQQNQAVHGKLETRTRDTVCEYKQQQTNAKVLGAFCET